MKPKQIIELPLENGLVCIPIGMSEDDYQLLMDALDLFRSKLVSKPTYTNDCGLP